MGLRVDIYRFIMLWLQLLIFNIVSATNPTGIYLGDTQSNPIDLQAYSGYFQVVHTADATQWGYTADSGAEYGKEIFYRITLPERMSLIVHTYGSELLCTNVQIYGPGNSTIYRARNKNDYLDYYSQLYGSNDSVCAISQDCFVAFDCPPGVYDIRSRGYRYYNGNIVNGPIKTTIIGFSDDAPTYKDIPERYIPGTIYRPFQLGNYGADFNIHVDTCYSESFFTLRGSPQIAYYEFGINREMSLTINATKFRGALNVNGDSTTIGIVDSIPITMSQCLPGRYLAVAFFNDTTAIDFSISGKVPPSISEGEYHPIDIYDRSIVGKNYVSTKTMLDATGQNYAERISHVDGLGRSVQDVLVKASSNDSSIVTRVEYDSSGRCFRSWLPTVTSEQSDKNYYTNPSTLDYSTVYNGDTHPFTTEVYESSPLSRIIQQFNPGEEWYKSASAINSEYLLNTDTGELSCICFTVTNSSDNLSIPVSISCGTEYGGSINYSAGELTVTRVTNEDGNRSYVFKDAFNRTILQRRIHQGAFVDTYYIYDVYGNLTAVLPPELSAKISGATTLVSGQSELLDLYAYVYTYDSRQRMISKRLPGLEKIEYVYDNADRCILWRDGNTRSLGKWHFDIFDAFGRSCLSGLCSENTHLSASDAIVRAIRRDTTTNNLFGYSISGLVLLEPQVLTVNYYDDYSFIGQYGCLGNNSLGFESDFNYGDRYENVKGLNTGRAIAIPIESATDSLKYLFSVNYYDSRDRVVQSVGANHIGGIDRVLTQYDFAGRPIRTESIHSTSLQIDSTAIIQQWERTYDQFSRELVVRHRLGRSGEWMEISENDYDDIGRLSERNRGTYGDMTETYVYDVRSRLTSINAAYYRQQLTYTPGGNVNKMAWWSYRPNSSERNFSYVYDDLSRIISAHYTDTNGNTGIYDTNYDYDLNGNIITLSRNGLYNSSYYYEQYGLIDDLTFEYSGNKLQSVSDNCFGPFYQGAHHFVNGSDEVVEYGYDANGNTVVDFNRGIVSSIYDFNNRPRQINFSDGSQTCYLYNALGQKLRTTHRVATVPVTMPEANVETPDIMTSVTDYCGDIVYEDSLLSRIYFDGGYLSYVDYSGGRLPQPEYHFYFRDHLGSNRVDVTDIGGVWQAMDYYPYGMPMGSSYLPGKQHRLFGGKELDRVSGLDLYDFESRQYDSSIGRFRSPDPHLESYLDISPVVFGLNNPMIYADPTGKDAIVTIENKTITIRADVILTGKYATEDLAKIYLEDIKNTWGKITEYSHGDEIYSVVWDVNVRVISDGEKINYDGKNNYMEVLNSSEISKVIETNHGKIRSKGTGGRDLKNDNPMSHEFGHFLGLRDKYDQKTKKPKSAEWENDIMATPTSKKNRIISSGTQSNLFIPILESNKAFNNIKRLPILNLLLKNKTFTYPINKYRRER